MPSRREVPRTGHETPTRGRCKEPDLWNDEQLREALLHCADELIDHLGEEEPAIEAQAVDPLPEGTTTLHGELSCFPIASVLQFLAINAKTGMLRVMGPNRRFRLTVREGDLVHATCDPRPYDEQLGSILLERGATSAEDLGRFINRCLKEKRRKLGELLTEEGIITPEELREALDHQIRLLIEHLMATREADFEFIEYDPLPPPNHVQIGVMGLLLESARVDGQDQGPRL